MVGLIAINAIIAIYSLIRLGPVGFEQILLSFGFGVTMIALVVVSGALSYRM